MIKLFETLGFGAIALAAHLVMLFGIPDSGSQAGGEAGEHLLSLQGSNPQIEQLVAEWTAPAEPIIEAMVEPVIEPVIEKTAPIKPVKPAAKPVDIPTERIPNATPALPIVEPVQTPEVAAPSDIMLVQPKSRPKTVKQIEQPKPKVAKTPKPKAPAKKTATKSSSASKAQTKQKAAGNGGGKSAGNAGKSAVKSGKSANSAKALEVWGAQIRRAIERRKGSVRGIKARATVTIRVNVAANGQVLSFQIAKRSGNAKADNAALKTLNGIKSMPKAVKGVSKSKHSFVIPMIYQP
ncbi:hypothetical protein GCM10008927_18450 [Amylibacter ulvae]|uniref:TonB C-terminal domain-containing protein n=1 Tax=Paramylibacter ulvae TaxID=1651968 RepID=A0ABQ3D2U9_9RHOB|nr:TonB family protein [Amylibacter ulvae]GHA52989.1 hypothetical protein GCM10008927_18450 [Amylibacter ulvae]